MKKRIVSLLMCMVMALSLWPMTAFAEDDIGGTCTESHTDEDNNHICDVCKTLLVAEINGRYYDDFDKAWNYALSLDQDAKISVFNDVTVKQSLAPLNNGHTVTIEAEDEENAPCIELPGQYFLVQNGTLVMGVDVKYTAENLDCVFEVAGENAGLSIKSGNYNMRYVHYNDDSAMIKASQGAAINISGGSMRDAATALCVNDSKNIVITGGTFHGCDCGLSLTNGSAATISDGTFKSDKSCAIIVDSGSVQDLLATESKYYRADNGELLTIEEGATVIEPNVEVVRKTFDINITTEGKGTVECKQKGWNTEKIKLTIKPEPGYHFKEWQTTDVTIGENNTFVMPEKAVSIKAVFEASDPVSYLDEKGEGQTVKNYVILNNNNRMTELTSGWYIVDGDVTINSRIETTGDVHLVLKDGAVLTTKAGIRVAEGNSLTIYGQSTDHAGTLTDYDYRSNTEDAGIGGNENENSGFITINGGNITAHGSLAAGIGGGNNGAGNVTINGGDVTVWSAFFGAGIGGGMEAGGDVTINGGTVTATAQGGACIGGGLSASGTVVINGGTITASNTYDGAGIGGGHGGAGNVTINGGTVTATAEEGAGIGGGIYKNGIVVINGGTVSATSTKGTGIGSGKLGTYSDYGKGVVIVTGGTIDAYGASIAIGGEKNTTVSSALAEGHMLRVKTVKDGETEEADIDESQSFSEFVTGKPEVHIKVISLPEVKYLDSTGAEQTRKKYKYLTGNETQIESGWYVASGEIEFTNRPKVKGDVHLILTDGCRLEATNGIDVYYEESLTIYAQSEGKDAGTLLAKSEQNSIFNTHSAAIGSNAGERGSGLITINGGNITAHATGSGAGIGGGLYGYGKVTINGGRIDSTSESGYGIGGGDEGYCIVTITDGIIKASGSKNAQAIGPCSKEESSIVISPKEGLCLNVTAEGKEVEGSPFLHEDGKEFKELLSTHYEVLIKEGRVVNIKPNEHGTAIADPCVAETGETVTLTAIPETGWHFKRWISGNVTIDENGSFTMPAYKETIELEFEACEFTQENTDEKYLKSEANCTTGTVYYKSCSVCGAASETETFEVGEPKHDWDPEDYTIDFEPTCTQPGQKTVHCKKCEATMKAEIPATGHTFTQENTDEKYLKSAANCKSPAVYYKSCSVCGEASDKDTFTYGEIDPLAHGTPVTKYAKKATVDAEGYTGDQVCSLCGQVLTKGSVIPKLTPKKGDVKYDENKILNKTTDSDAEGSTFKGLTARIYSTAKTSVTIRWKKVSGATAYNVYAARCNASGKKYKLKKVASVKAGKYSFKYSKLKKGTYYKFIVMAVKGSKTASTSKTLHIATAGGKYTNIKSLTLNKTKLSLKKGKTFTVRVKKKTLFKRGKKNPTHRKISYESSNKKIATVSSKGVIKGIGKGKCTIYVYAQDGAYKKVTVAVK